MKLKWFCITIDIFVYFRRVMWLITRTILIVCSPYMELNKQLSIGDNLKYLWHSEVLGSSMIKLIYKKT